MTYQSKTDWKYDDIVKETDLNRIEQGIHDVHAELDKVPSVPITLKSGLQTITANRDTPLRITNIRGRTLINLLGRDGKCEDINVWNSLNYAVRELNSENKVYGNTSIKITATSTSTQGFSRRFNLKLNSYYVAVSYIKNESFSSFSGMQYWDGISEIVDSNNIEISTKFKAAVLKFRYTQGTSPTIYFYGQGEAGNVMYIDGIRLYEITEAEYNTIDSMTPEQVAAKYPYVDSLQNVNRVYLSTKADDGRETYMYLPTCQLASNPDGSVADRMYMDNEGRPRAVRHFRRMELDGNLDWKNSFKNQQFKTVSAFVDNNAITSNSNDNPDAHFVVKYDGRILGKYYSSSADGRPDTSSISSGAVHIIIANSDSGWGPDYEPSQDEIKAYFWGWRMYDASTSDARSPYNGKPGQIKGWVEMWSAGNPTGITPTTLSPGYTPYLLQYKLANPIDEPLGHEGSLMLYEGTNKVEVGTGIVVREKANPRFSANSGLISINGGEDFTSKLDLRPLKLLSIYRNSSKDNVWDLIQRSSVNLTYGIGSAGIEPSYYDPSAVYQVTYLALDNYKIGIAPTEISIEYASNLRGTVDSLVEESKNALARITVLENEKATKELPQRIKPTLLNGWEDYGGDYERSFYYKDESNVVTIMGLVSKGISTAGTPLFILPVGFRPDKTLIFPVNGYVTGIGDSFIRIDVDPTGIVKLASSNAKNDYISLQGITFRAYK